MSARAKILALAFAGIFMGAANAKCPEQSVVAAPEYMQYTITVKVLNGNGGKLLQMAQVVTPANEIAPIAVQEQIAYVKSVTKTQRGEHGSAVTDIAPGVVTAGLEGTFLVHDANGESGLSFCVKSVELLELAKAQVDGMEVQLPRILKREFSVSGVPLQIGKEQQFHSQDGLSLVLRVERFNKAT